MNRPIVKIVATDGKAYRDLERARILRETVELIDGQLFLRRTGKALSTRPDKDGYLIFTITWEGKMVYYSAHRAIWFLHYGNWPEGEIDHLNNIRDDNRVENLEDVSREENERRRFARRQAANDQSAQGKVA